MSERVSDEDLEGALYHACSSGTPTPQKVRDAIIAMAIELRSRRAADLTAAAPDARKDLIAAHLWLTQHGVRMLTTDGHPATLTECVKLLAASRTEALATAEDFNQQRVAAVRMHETATQNAVDAKARAEYVTKQRDQFAEAIDRMQPIRSLLADWEFAELDRHDLARNDALADRVVEALRSVEAAEKKAKWEAGRG
jgi:hypothetical protein